MDVEKTVPFKCAEIKNRIRRKPWITRGLVEHIKTRRKLYRKFLKKLITFGQQYREYGNRASSMLIDAKKWYYNSKFKYTVGNSNKIWNLINNIINKKEETTKLE